MTDPDRTGDFHPARPDPPAADPAPPAAVGRYRVEKVLGRGGFGLVYLARDPQLHRLVAVKVPHRHRVATPAAADAYLAEARAVAGLDHPHVVPVYDVGSADDCPCFIVSKFVDGTDLAATIAAARPSPRAAAGLVATVAEALHFAHTRGLVHRDVKPGNILLDAGGVPFVADFGLALREEDVGTGPRYAGTPAYMSPEQARGEGHRVDGRSDVFSLGVVLYELLTGRLPFRADSRAGLMEEITGAEPRPPRQYDDGIPKELERVCLKALAKRASERYSTARDMADDLRHHLLDPPGGAAPRTDPPAAAAGARPASTAGGPGTAVTPAPPPSDSQPLRIVPKGLRAFDAHDADFFLELLPGPRDRDGLPDGVRFWKLRLEEADADNTFPVGLIYGPSGCGKSSLVRAGLLPRLSAAVTAVYVEATADETETRLLNGLRKRCPALPADLGLKDALAALRRGRGAPAGTKVVVVLDQFEQWLHARKDEPGTELVQALRQCDGGRVQCVVMVRDDFWMAATRFMRELEVRLLEGQNSAAVDLFPARHAEKVLAAFGRAFGALPDAPGGAAGGHAEFVTRAVAGLAQEGKVVSVRVALFAEMMKGRAWTPAALAEVGGAAGVGVTFLEETFGAAAAPPEHRYHQAAARRVLKALLPETGSDIKGHMRSHAELLEASGYGGRRRDFDDLTRILDGEMRLITPTDPDGREEKSAAPSEPGQKYYQLTHDYLVPSLRDWLTRKQKETRRGRAELLLADRAAVWAARPENRQLPSLWQWLGVRWLTAGAGWSPPERAMMRRAGRYHAGRCALLAGCLALLGLAGWDGYGRLEARTLRDRLLEATTAEAPAVVGQMPPYRRWIDPLLREALAHAGAANDARKQLHAALALLPVDPGQVDVLHGRLLAGDPQEVVVIRDALAPHRADLTEQLWRVVETPESDPGRRLRAACALAAFAPDDARWGTAGGDVAAALAAQNPFAVARWADALKPVGNRLMPPLAGFLVDEGRTVPARGLIASLYGVFAADSPDGYARLERGLAEAGEPGAADDQSALARRQASLGVALLVMGRGEKVWPLLAHAPDPTRRSHLIDRLSPGGVPHTALTARLGDEPEVSVRRAILLCLGEYGPDRMSPAERRHLVPRLLHLYQTDPDAGVHGAAEWLLRRWGADDQLPALDRGPAGGRVEGHRRWHVSGQGHLMTVVARPDVFWMGEREERHRRAIGRDFAISAKEVTVADYLRFRKDHEYFKDYVSTPACPVNKVSWFDAAAYCNWLSEREGIPKEQWCYSPNDSGGYAAGMRIAPDFLRRTGYRLPTEAEWEYACRAGAATSYSFGNDTGVVGKYGWFESNSLGKARPVAVLYPNEFGLWDMHGNNWEWVHDPYVPYPAARPGEVVEDREGALAPDWGVNRVLRGGSFVDNASYVRSATRAGNTPATRVNNNGFRVARTLPP